MTHSPQSDASIRLTHQRLNIYPETIERGLIIAKPQLLQFFIIKYMAVSFIINFYNFFVPEELTEAGSGITTTVAAQKLETNKSFQHH